MPTGTETGELLTIAEDGIIDEAERPMFDEITGDLDGIIGAALQVKYTSDAPPKTKKNAPRRQPQSVRFRDLHPRTIAKLLYHIRHGLQAPL